MHRENNFIAASRKLTTYRSESNFILDHQNNYVGCLKYDNVAANNFDILATKLNVRYFYKMIWHNYFPHNYSFRVGMRLQKRKNFT